MLMYRMYTPLSQLFSPCLTLAREIVVLRTIENKKRRQDRIRRPAGHKARPGSFARRAGSKPTTDNKAVKPASSDTGAANERRRINQRRE
ncbi:hypothetical protein B0T39_14965 [Chromobacterium haemolyticum]|nr:hypothetical protein B0T39_14965 [Chromobacterium haemolyticum]